MAGHLILFFVCAHIGPGLSVYVHFYIPVTQVSGHPGLYNEVGFIGCPHAPLSRLVLLSCLHSFVFCARTCTFGPHLSFTPPLGEACVCNPCSHRDPDGLFSHRFSAFVFQQGDWSRFAYPVQRSYGISVDEWSDQPLVPAQFLNLW